MRPLLFFYLLALFTCLGQQSAFATSIHFPPQNFPDLDDPISPESSQGHFQWASSMVSEDQRLKINDQALLPDGSIAVVGEFYGKVNLGKGFRKVQFESKETTGFFAKYHPNGTLHWAKKIQNTDLSNTGEKVAILKDGTILFVGSFGGTITIENNVVLTAAMRDALFMARYSSDGTLVQAKKIVDGAVYIGINAIEISQSGAILLAGSLYNGKIIFSPQDSNQITLTTPPDTQYFFVARFNENGAIQWVTPMQAASRLYSHITAMKATGSGDSDSFVVTGTYRKGITVSGTTFPGADWNVDMFFFKFSTTDGSLLWGRTVKAGEYKDRLKAEAITITSDKDILIAGSFEKRVNFVTCKSEHLIIPRDNHPVPEIKTICTEETVTPQYLESYGGRDAFVARYSLDQGELLWVRQAGDIDADGASEIVSLPNGDFVIAGKFEHTITFSKGLSSEKKIISNKKENIFITRYDPAGRAIWTQYVQGSPEPYVSGLSATNNRVILSGNYSGITIFGKGTDRETELPLTAGQYYSKSTDYDGFIAKFYQDLHYSGKLDSADAQKTITVETPAKIVLKKGFSVTKGAKFRAFRTEAKLDYDPPLLISGYPLTGELIDTANGNVALIHTFWDDSRIVSFTLLDASGTDISSKANFDGTTVTFLLENPEDKIHEYTLIVENESGEVTTLPIRFTTDSTIPETKASKAGGRYSGSINVDLISSETATIYYSTDGYPPFEGAANTKAAPSPVRGVTINGNTKLQFFAVDPSGNREQTKSETYFFGQLPSPAVLTGLIYDPGTGRVNLSWLTADGNGNRYHLYRVNNPVDHEILESGTQQGIHAPKRLRLTETPITGSTHSDQTVIPGGTYWYAVSVVDQNGIESVISKPEQVTITAGVKAVTSEESIQRGVAWLEARQNRNGSWGAGSDRLFTTGQILRYLETTKRDNAGIRKALFYLRGHHADNNAYLANQIVALAKYNQNVRRLTSRLIANGVIANGKVTGWGPQKRYRINAFESSLGSEALRYAPTDLRDRNGVLDTFRSETVSNDSTKSTMKNREGHYGWVRGGKSSLYVSARVYNQLQANPTEYQWIQDRQAADGSFGNIADTASALLWLRLPPESKTKAINYLIAQQSLDGSWKGEPTLTALCLEALGMDEQ